MEKRDTFNETEKETMRLKRKSETKAETLNWRNKEKGEITGNLNKRTLNSVISDEGVACVQIVLDLDPRRSPEGFSLSPASYSWVATKITIGLTVKTFRSCATLSPIFAEEFIKAEIYRYCAGQETLAVQAPPRRTESKTKENKDKETA